MFQTFYHLFLFCTEKLASDLLPDSAQPLGLDPAWIQPARVTWTNLQMELRSWTEKNCACVAIGLCVTKFRLYRTSPKNLAANQGPDKESLPTSDLLNSVEPKRRPKVKHVKTTSVSLRNFLKTAFTDLQTVARYSTSKGKAGFRTARSMLRAFCCIHQVYTVSIRIACFVNCCNVRFM